MIYLRKDPLVGSKLFLKRILTFEDNLRISDNMECMVDNVELLDILIKNNFLHKNDQ
jgi:hypothetical protein